MTIPASMQHRLSLSRVETTITSTLATSVTHAATLTTTKRPTKIVTLYGSWFVCLLGKKAWGSKDTVIWRSVQIGNEMEKTARLGRLDRVKGWAIRINRHLRQSILGQSDVTGVSHLKPGWNGTFSPTTIPKLLLQQPMPCFTLGVTKHLDAGFKGISLPSQVSCYLWHCTAPAFIPPL